MSFGGSPTACGKVNEGSQVDITQHLFLIRLIFLSDSFIAVTVQFISVENCFPRDIMKFEYLKNRWVYVVSIYRC